MNVAVTVLMPVYNGEKYLIEAIDSVLEQSFTNFELLIVNDGSTDKTEEILRSYKDERLRYINQANAGVSAALNTGLKQARGNYIARFDADDVCYPKRLELQFSFMETYPDFIMIGSDADYMSEEGEFLFTYKNTGYSNEEINEHLEVYCPFIHSSVFYVKQAVLDCGLYNVNAHSFEDYFLWIHLIKLGKVCNFKEPLIKVRFNASSVTVDEKDREAVFVEIKKKALKTGTITDAEGSLLLKSIKRLDKQKKESSYHRMLGKKYLWNNYQPAKARKHLIQSARLEPLKMNTYLLLAFSFLPKKLIDRIYKIK
jgi:glycosyltransferase involved in cell wall biosynthesis